MSGATREVIVDQIMGPFGKTAEERMKKKVALYKTLIAEINPTLYSYIMIEDPRASKKTHAHLFSVAVFFGGQLVITLSPPIFGEVHIALHGPYWKTGDIYKTELERKINLKKIRIAILGLFLMWIGKKHDADTKALLDLICGGEGGSKSDVISFERNELDPIKYGIRVYVLFYGHRVIAIKQQQQQEPQCGLLFRLEQTSLAAAEGYTVDTRVKRIALGNIGAELDTLLAHFERYCHRRCRRGGGK